MLQFCRMCKLCIFIGMTLFGWIGWILGEKAGVMIGFLISGAGSLVGVYLGWRLYRDYLE